MRELRAVMGAALLALAAMSWGAGPAVAAEDEIRIGAVWGLTGPTAGVSQEGRRGMEMAQELINRKGVLGKKIRVIFEDDKADPAVGVSATEKLITQDKGVAFVGGVGSTICNAMLGAFEKYNPRPIGVLTGCGATTIEQRFGKERGYFFVHPWEYYYQSTMRDFLLSLTPRPQTVFIAHEDRLYGTSHAKMADEYFKEAGFKVVAREGFKSGAPDLTPLLTRAKGMNPDVFYWIAYGADAILITKQGKELGFNPRLYASTVQLGTQEYRDAVGLERVVVDTYQSVSGTGAEATRTAVLTGPVKKLGINSDQSIYDAVLMDPELLSTVPAEQEFYTAMDCFIHCVESLNGSLINEIGKGFASKSKEMMESFFLREKNYGELMVAS